jgi:uncharacterized protein YprB with RNaseH-like and TPR domain
VQLDSQVFLDLVEDAHKICFVDIESTGLKGDYNSALVVSVKPYNLKPVSFSVKQPGYDIKVVRDAKECMESFACWVTYYGKGFDIPFLNTRLLRWSQEPIAKRPHIDMYYSLKYNLLTGRKSQAHLLRFLDCDQQKMDMSPTEWTEVLATGDTKRMVLRCESDTAGLESLYKKTRHLIKEIKA